MVKVLTVYRDLPEIEPYRAAMLAAKLEPVFVPASEPASLHGMDGLLLMGGCDVEPARFGQAPEPETEQPDPERDQLEIDLIEQAISHDLPLFGICRGLQILNVQQGGTLTQHLPGHERHRRRTADRGVPAHPVCIEPGTLLATIAGAASAWQVNSRHHQAVDRLAPGLRVSAFDPLDGTVEAVERPGSRFVLAVQWHPENQAPNQPDQAALFHAFAQACGA